MLLRRDGDDVIAITQPAHAWLSGQLARAWGNERFGALEPWEEVCLGAEQHDVGMTAWEQAPTLNPDTGLPRSFMELPLDEHLAMWSAAAGLVAPQSRYAALLVSLHGTALYERRDLSRLSPQQADAVREYLAGQRALQARLTAETRVDGAPLRRLQRQLFAWDWLSLALCLKWAPSSLPGVPAAEGEVEIRLTHAADAHALRPWPFATDTLTVMCEGRRLTGHARTRGELHDALERAPRIVLRFELLPA
jgi:hypothetical protein